MGNKKKNGFFQPVWNTTSNRVIAAVMAWIGMVVILLAVFLLPMGDVSIGSGLVGMLASTVLDALLPVSSFTLWDACVENVLILVLLIFAILLGVVIPFVTAMPLELIPLAMFLGIDIYAVLCKLNILIRLNLRSLGQETSSANIASYSGDLSQYGSGLVKLGMGFWLSIAGLVLMLVSVILFFALKPADKRESAKPYAPEEADTAFDDDQAYAGKQEDIYAADQGEFHGGNRYAETELFGGNTSETARDTSDTVPMAPPAGRLVRLNNGETYFLKEGDVVIGRDASKSDIVISSNFISGVHARIITNDGYSGIVDMHSTNGTFVNDQRLVPDIKASLKNGDYVSLGAEILQYFQG